MRKKANADLRAYSEKKGVPQWAIARGWGIADTTLCRWLREEFDKEKKARYRQIVDSIAAGEEA